MSWRWKLRLALLAIGILTAVSISYRHELLPKRVAVLEPGKLIRGAWQRPIPLRRIIKNEKIKTIVSLTAINTYDPKYVDQSKVVDETGVDWIIIPMRGSTATLEQLGEAADLLGDPRRQPVFFHCVAGHHRTNLTLGAYWIRHCGYSTERAWEELRRFSWTRPDRDQDDRLLLEQFAASQFGSEETLR